MGMVQRFVESAKKFLQWGKVILPFSYIKFYPPQFVIRNPVVEGVKAAFHQHREVVVIVFNLKNINELAEQLGQFHHIRYMRSLKRYFRVIIEQELTKGDIISLHDFSGEGVTLYFKASDHSSISEIDGIVNKITNEVEQTLRIQQPAVIPQFNTGYMFVEKKLTSVEDAVALAQKRATMMAEKRVDSEYNELVYTMSKIILQKNIKLLAQPIINLATNQIQAWEMLSRGPKGTLLESPLTLFSVARQTGMLYDLEMIVFEKALQQIKETECRQDIFVNCTPLTLGNMSFIRDLKSLLHKFRGISPEQITFEITERDSIEEIKDFIHNIRVLRLMGFKIAIDDTGSGYASLNTISEVMPDIIKIDRSVIENIDKNTVKESMLKGLLLVAKEAGSLVVAEGIENAEEASVLTRNKVDLAQGYFYAKPAVMVKNFAT
ncbi:MAG: EAL domain-containing protein [Bacillota bacterium]|nr:EAL domain-containing protein [Bacillota bacterium]